jgi:hypothetical protein
MNKYKLVAVSIAVVERHRFGAAGHKKRHIVVAEEGNRSAVCVVLVAGL